MFGELLNYSQKTAFKVKSDVASLWATFGNVWVTLPNIPTSGHTAGKAHSNTIPTIKQ